MKIEISSGKDQVALLYFSTLVGVLLGIISSIINTRFLDPLAYGDVRYVQNIINLVASLLLFGYFLSGSRLLALSKDDQYSSRVRGAMVIILLIACVILMSVTGLCYFIYNNSSVSILFLVSIPVCISPLLGNYVNTTAQGDNQIVRLSISRLLPALLYVSIAYLIYKNFGASSTKMIFLQWGISTLVLLVVIISTHPSFKNLRPIFAELHRENRDYGFQLYLGSLVMVSTNYLAGIFIGQFNEDYSQVGFYTLALTITSPLTMLPAIIGTTYFKQVASEPKIPTRLMRFSLLLTIVSGILFVLVIKPLVVFLYSESYSIVSLYASVLAIGSCIHGFGDMLNRYLGSHGQGVSIRNASIANGIFKILGYSVLVFYFNTMGAVITTIACDIIYTAVLIVYYKRFVNRY